MLCQFLKYVVLFFVAAVSFNSYKSYYMRLTSPISNYHPQIVDSRLPGTAKNYRFTVAKICLTNIPSRPALINGYIGALQALKAKHTWTPIINWNIWNDAENTLKVRLYLRPAIISRSGFMRFLSNITCFFTAIKNLTADKEEIIKWLINKYCAGRQTAGENYYQFLIASKRCNTAIKCEFKQHLTVL